MSFSREERIRHIHDLAKECVKLRHEVAEILHGDIIDLASQMAAVIGAGSKILVCGNGGSAADSSHLVGELVVRLSADRSRTALPAISLSADSTVLTAAGNDFGFEKIFSRQVEALGIKGDMLLALSTSGKSANLLSAVAAAKKKSMLTAALIGADGGDLVNAVERSVVIPSDSVQRIQEEQKFIIHLLVELVESDLFG